MAGRPGLLQAFILVSISFQLKTFLLIDSRNGLKWNDLVAKDLGLELINLATGGATTNNNFVAGGTGAQSTIPVPSASDQVLSFLSWDKPRPDDVFVHWIGANDILFNTSITGGQVTSLINENVDRLYHAGTTLESIPNSHLCLLT